jgi:hypothetical protein
MRKQPYGYQTRQLSLLFLIQGLLGTKNRLDFVESESYCVRGNRID